MFHEVTTERINLLYLKSIPTNIKKIWPCNILCISSLNYTYIITLRQTRLCTKLSEFKKYIVSSNWFEEKKFMNVSEQNLCTDEKE
jgi:hypothetical protein